MPTTEEDKKHGIEVWKTVVGVQQHFNDIEMRIRSLFVTILLALLASMGFLMDKKLSFFIGKLNIQFATIIPLFGVFGAWLFYFIDRYWYHRLLVGSVNHAIEIERKYKDEIPEISLSAAIGKESPYRPKWWFVRFLACLLVQEPRYKQTGALHSDAKIELFYKSVITLLFLVAITVALFGGITFAGQQVLKYGD